MAGRLKRWEAGQRAELARLVGFLEALRARVRGSERDGVARAAVSWGRTGSSEAVQARFYARTGGEEALPPEMYDDAG